MHRFPALLLLLHVVNPIQAQNSFSFNCVKDTTIDCTVQCISLKAVIPDIFTSTNSYTVNKFSTATCFRGYVSPASPGSSANLTIDDRYSPLIDITFPFSFYGLTYSKLAASTNGFLTFDNSKALTFSHYGVLANGTMLSSTVGTPQDLPSSLYDGAIIMGPYHDLDPNSPNGSTSTQQIKYDIVGTAPYRKWIISYYNVPLYTTACLNLATNTHQIVLYETLNIVEVFIYDKEICPNWNNGRSIIGMQGLNKTSAIMAPGRQATSALWGAKGLNESWRFVPSTGSSLFARAELYSLSGAFIAKGIAAPIANGLIDLQFDNVCPPPAGQMYVVKSFYKNPDGSANEIMGTDTINVSRGEPIMADVTPANCSGGSGFITVTSPAGPAYEYSLDGTNWQSSNVFTVSVGNYTVRSRITGSNCISNKSFSVGSLKLDALIYVTPTLCAGPPTGTITIVPVNGTAPYQYSLNGNAFRNGNTFVNLPSGNYTVTVTDATGCSFTTTAFIAATGPIFSTNVKNAVCGSTTGSISVSVSSGVAPFSYSISGGPFQSSNVFNNLAAGMYSITVQDATACITTLPASVSTDAPFTTTLAMKLPTCFGGNDGSVTVNPSGNSMYLYALDAGPFQTSNLFNNLTSGSYMVHIKDTTGCIKDTAVTLQQPNVFKITNIATSATSCASADGQITLKANGGTTPYLYSIDNGKTFSVNNIFPGIKSGTYSLVVKDNNGCLASELATVIANTNTMTLELGPDKNLCSGDSISLIPAITPPADYFRWSPAAGLSDTTSGAPKVSPPDTIKYHLIARTGYCERRDSITINVLHKPVVNAGADTAICNGTSATLRGSATNLSGAVNYLWIPSGDFVNPASPTSVVWPKVSRVNSYVLQVSDTYGCNFKVYDEVKVTMGARVPAFAGNDTVASIGIPHQLFGSGGVKYVWTPGNVLNDPFSQNPVAILSNDTKFNLVVTDTIGCKGTSSVTIKVYKGITYYVPNAFSPNGDGINDVFRAVAPGIQATGYFKIFNRWGKLMYQTTDVTKGWDGTYAGVPQPAGVYVWIIKGVDISQKTLELRGIVTLVR